MIRVTSNDIHYFRENELGDQLKEATRTIWAKAHGLSVTAKLIESVIYDAENQETHGIPMSKSDISYAVGLLSDYGRIIASNIGHISEVLEGDEVVNALNKLNADKRILEHEFRYRHNTFEEDQAKAKTA